ncbi:hypothetical protein MKZ38_010408 [Zalerion maritima]|uniref:Uncharacterized protein n=1 Tax=Zalerion maritima TaxID=339359 RepID=A0AAD5RTK7_9PEZI|nr:hypothetical protein MKZ38_010408 [Zalerion maritima]
MRNRIKPRAPAATHPAFLPVILLSTRQTLLQNLVKAEQERVSRLEAVHSNGEHGFTTIRRGRIDGDWTKDDGNSKTALSIVQLVTAWEHHSQTLLRELHASSGAANMQKEIFWLLNFAAEHKQQTFFYLHIKYYKRNLPVRARDLGIA